MRRYLIRKTEQKTQPETLAILKDRIIIPSPKTLTANIPDGGNIAQFKFVREKEQIIMFADTRENQTEQIMHIHYAVANRMSLPDDGEIIRLYNRGLCEIRDSSSSPHLPPTNNPARPRTIELFSLIISPQMVLKQV